MKDVISAIKSEGFQVYTRGEDATYAFFTDGKNIGYIEKGSGGYRLSTVHKPSTQVGTGFDVGLIEHITKSILEQAFVKAPKWAIKDVQAVTKWEDWESFHNSDSWTKGYVLQ